VRGVQWIYLKLQAHIKVSLIKSVCAFGFIINLSVNYFLGPVTVYWTPS